MISADNLYEGLLEYGMSVNKLPPVFTTVPFFHYCKAETQLFSDKRDDYVPYSLMRNINIPRAFGIPTTMKYQPLCSTSLERD